MKAKPMHFPSLNMSSVLIPIFLLTSEALWGLTPGRVQGLASPVGSERSLHLNSKLKS